MRRTWRPSVRMGLVVLASASLALAPGLGAAQSHSGSDQVSNGAQQTGQGATETARNSGQTGGRSGPGAGDVGDRLHDSAKGFGEAILGGIKYAGRTVIGFFTGDKPKN
jgi:hypothetical protein